MRWSPGCIIVPLSLSFLIAGGADPAGAEGTASSSIPQAATFAGKGSPYADLIKNIPVSLKFTRLHAARTSPAQGERVQAGGEDATTATVIPFLPFADTGNTCSSLNDYEPPCGASGGPDVVYQYTASADGCLNVSLCGSNYDTEVYVAQDAPFSIIACNDDFCGISSQVNDVPIGAGHTYYIIVDGFGGDCGDYDLQVTQGC